MASGAPIAMPSGDYSYRWGGIIPQDNDSFKTLSRVNSAQSAEEILNLVKGSHGVTVNIIFCDVICILTCRIWADTGISDMPPLGRILSDKKMLVGEEANQLGHRVSRGWVAENEWDDYIDGDDKPYLFNPKKGYIVMANNPISTMNTKSIISTYTLGTSRAYRITEMLEELIENKSKNLEIS